MFQRNLPLTPSGKKYSYREDGGSRLLETLIMIYQTIRYKTEESNFRAHNNLPFILILSQLNLIHTQTRYLFKTSIKPVEVSEVINIAF
jgi:hypothetical protein